MTIDAGSDYNFPQQVGHLLRRAYQRHTSIFQSTVPDAQLTATHFVILLTLRDQPNAGIAAIAKATALDEPSVRAMVERLKWRQLVKTQSEPGDGRNMTAALTPAGRAVIADTTPYAFEVSRKTLAPLNPEDQATLLRLLRQIAGFEA